VAAENKEKPKNGLQIVLVVLVLISMGLNVYLFRYHSEQVEQVSSVEVMASWELSNAQIQEELAAIKASLVELETRQVEQETSTREILSLVESASWASEILSLLNSEPWTDELSALAETLAPHGVDKESWEASSSQIQEELAAIKSSLGELETRQVAQETAAKEVLVLLEDAPWASEILRILESEPWAHELSSLAERLTSTGVDKESWEAANAQIHEELAAIKALLELVFDEAEVMPESELESEAVTAIAPNPSSPQRQELEEEAGIQVMAAASTPVPSELANGEAGQGLMGEEGHVCPTIEVKLLPGDSVWSIVARFRPSPSPELVEKVVAYNEITDPRRLPVGFPVKVPMDLVNGL
jgi:hypothetical protein